MNLQHSILNQLQTKKQFENIDFLKETCQQINKDLNGYSDAEIRLTEGLLENPLHDLTEQLIIIISALENRKVLKPFIYTVDLSEKKFVSFLLGENDTGQLAYDIVERCAQKVYLRWHFSNRLNH